MRPKWITNAALAAAVITTMAAAAMPAAANDLTISAPTTFNSLDGSVNDMDGVKNGVLTIDNLMIVNGGSITNNDPSYPSSASAGPIRIVVNGSVAMLAGSAITAENSYGSGSGGSISISCANLALSGAAGTTPGALISSRNKASCSSPGASGNISILSSSFSSEPGSVITAGRSTSTDKGSGGQIGIFGDFISINGEISSRSAMGSSCYHQAPGGGSITIDSTLSLSVYDSAVISSRGLDPGADLVHLEGILVFVGGLVESTGYGNSTPNSPANHLGPAAHPGKSPHAAAGIEIWGDYVALDHTTTKGELNADVGRPSGCGSNGGCGGGYGWNCYGGGSNTNPLSDGNAWIDVFAQDDLQITGALTGNYLIHANGWLNQASDDAGTINIKCIVGDVSASGLAIQADSTNTGGSGGQIIVEAYDALWFGTAKLSARGDYTTSCGWGSNGLGNGGHITTKAYNGALAWTLGVGDVRPTGSNVPTNQAGIISTSYNSGYDFSATIFPYTGTPLPLAKIHLSGGAPQLPSSVLLPHF